MTGGRRTLLAFHVADFFSRHGAIGAADAASGSRSARQAWNAQDRGLMGYFFTANILVHVDGEALDWPSQSGIPTVATRCLGTASSLDSASEPGRITHDP